MLPIMMAQQPVRKHVYLLIIISGENAPNSSFLLRCIHITAIPSEPILGALDGIQIIDKSHGIQEDDPQISY